MKKKIVLSVCLFVSLLFSTACEMSPAGAVDDDPVASKADAMKVECTETYECGTVTAPRECCRCWEIIAPWCGAWDPTCYYGICQNLTADLPATDSQ
jgi:hypothetical protein